MVQAALGLGAWGYVLKSRSAKICFMLSRGFSENTQFMHEQRAVLGYAMGKNRVAKKAISRWSHVATHSIDSRNHRDHCLGSHSARLGSLVFSFDSFSIQEFRVAVSPHFLEQVCVCSCESDLPRRQMLTRTLEMPR